MPSRLEPFGLVGLESLAAGKPVLVSSNSGLALLLKEWQTVSGLDHLYRLFVVDTPLTSKARHEGVAKWSDAIVAAIENIHDEDGARQLYAAANKARAYLVDEYTRHVREQWRAAVENSKALQVATDSASLSTRN